MSTNITPKAIVENCILLPAPDEVTPGIKITVYRVEARMHHLVPGSSWFVASWIRSAITMPLHSRVNLADRLKFLSVSIDR
jgi:hypothetical protein